MDPRLHQKGSFMEFLLITPRERYEYLTRQLIAWDSVQQWQRIIEAIGPFRL